MQLIVQKPSLTKEKKRASLVFWATKMILMFVASEWTRKGDEVPRGGRIKLAFGVSRSGTEIQSTESA